MGRKSLPAPLLWVRKSIISYSKVSAYRRPFHAQDSLLPVEQRERMNCVALCRVQRPLVWDNRDGPGVFDFTQGDNSSQPQ
jgi:hypothetical protein